MEWLLPVLVVVALVLLVGIYLWASYKSLQQLGGRVDAAWDDIAAQLALRADLLPPLVDTVTGYAAHEKAVLADVAKARDETLQAPSPAAAGAAEGHLQRALAALFAVAEAYPQLQSGNDFLQLQRRIVDAQDKIQASRRFYNGGVRELNAKVRVFPNTLFAKGLGLGQREFFEATGGTAVAEPPRIQF